MTTIVRLKHVKLAWCVVLCLTTVLTAIPVAGADENGPESVTGFALPAAGTLPGSKPSKAGTAAVVKATEPATTDSGNLKNTAVAGSGATSPGLTGKETIAALPPGLSFGKQPMVQESLLANGLRVLILEQREFPVVSTLMWYKTGSRTESAGSTGLSHLVEHLLFQHVGSFKEGEIGTAIARTGGQFNGYTSDDFITFFETLPAGRLELALKIESERMRQAKFDDGAVAREVANIQKEFENEERDPVAMVSREVRALLFMQHPYHNPVLGWRSDLDNLSAKQAKEFYDRYFQPGNATLVICGDVSAKNSLPLIQKYFGSIPAGPQLHEKNPMEGVAKSERRVSIRYPGKQEILQVGWHAPALESGDAAAMVILEKILNGGLNGRLKQRLVDAKLCAYAGASYEIKKEPGFFTITTSSIPSTLNAQQKMLDGIDAVLTGLKDKPLSDAELRRARNLATFAFYSECDGPYRAGFHLGYFDCLDKWQSSYNWAERLRGVTATDVMRVAKKYLSNDGRVVGWVQGTSAPKPASPPPAKTTDSTPKDHEKPAPSKMEHVRMSGYKTDDSAPGPGEGRNSVAKKSGAATTGNSNSREKSEDRKASDDRNGNKQKSHSSDQPLDLNEKPRQKSTNKSDHPIATPTDRTKSDAPNANSKPVSQTARPGVRAIPRLIEDIPEALGKATSNIPGAVGKVGAAIGSVPGAIGDLGVAVGHTASAIGKQIVQLGPRPEPVNGRVSRRVLRNGVNVLIFESHISPLVHIAGCIEAGDVYNPQEKPGLSAVAAAVLNQGGAKHSKAQMMALQDDLGVAAQQMLHFDNKMETIDFSTSCLSRDLSTQLDLIAESVSSPCLDETSLEHSRQEALSVLRRLEDSASQRVDRVLMQCLLAEKSPYCPSDPSDKSKSIASVNATELQKFFSSHIAPGATTIVVAGDIQPDQAATMMEKSFLNWNGKQTHQRLHAKESAKRVLRTAIPSKDSKKSTICFGQLVPIAPSHGDYGSLMIADGILVNHPMISRFEQQIAKTPALEAAMNNSEMTVGLDPVSNMAKWSLSISVEPNAVPVSVQTLKRELKQLSRNGVTAEEFAEVRRYLSGSMAVKDESTLYRVARNELDLAQHGGTVDGYAAVMSNLRNTSVDSVNRVIRTAFKPEQSTLVVAGSAQSIRAVRTNGTDSPAGSTGAARTNNSADEGE